MPAHPGTLWSGCASGRYRSGRTPDAPAVRLRRLLRGLLVVFASTGLFVSPARGQSPVEERAMRQWRDAGEFDAALARCREALARQELEHDARGGWTRWQIELSTEAILARDEFLEAAAWAAVDSLRDQFPRQSPPTLADIRVDLQHGISQRAHARAILATGDVPHLSSDQKRQAEQLLEAAARRFAALAKELPRSSGAEAPGEKPKSSPGTARRPGKEAARSGQPLRYQLAYEEAATRLMLASLHSVTSEARQRQAREAQLRLSTLTRITSDPALAESSRLLEVACLRLQGKAREADAMLRRLEERASAQSDTLLSLRILTEKVRVTESETNASGVEAWNRLRDAIQDITEGDPGIDADVDAEARVALMGRAAFFLDAVNASPPANNASAPSPAERDVWSKEIQLQRDYLSTHHPRWRLLQADRSTRAAGKRAATPTSESTPVPRASTPAKSDKEVAKPAPKPGTAKPTAATAAERTLLNALIQTINERKAQGNLDAALEPCEQAAALARKIGEEELCFQLTFQAAAIFHQRQNHDESLRRFRELALEFPRHARAADAHAIAIRHAAVSAPPADPQVAWDALLREHLQNWPEGKTANLCRLQLGRYLEQQGNSEEALSIWMQSDGESDVWLEQWLLLRAAFLRKLQTIDPATPSRNEFARSVAEYWRRWDSPAATLHVDATRAAALVYGSEWSLLFAPQLTRGPAELRAIRQRLDAVAQGKACPENLQALRQALTGLAAARAGDFAAAEVAWQGLAWNSLETTLPLLEQLDQFATEVASDKAAAEPWNRLESEILTQLQRIPSWADNPRTWQLTARIHQRRGERDEALKIYNRLLEKLPRDLPLRREAAALLDTGQTDAERQASLRNWQAFVEASEAGSADWFDGHYGLIRAMLRAGQRKEAERKLTELRTAHPDLGGDSQAARFRQLLDGGR